MISGVHISSSRVVFHPEKDLPASAPKFLKNQVVSAKVLKLFPKGGAQLSVDGKIITASTDLLLKPGEDIKLQVVQVKDEIVLKLTSPLLNTQSRYFSMLSHFFSKDDILPEIPRKGAGRFAGMLNDLALKSGRPDADFIPRLIEKAGLFFEQKLSAAAVNKKTPADMKVLLEKILNEDLKGIVMKQAASISASDDQQTSAAARMKDAIESFQLLNQFSGESGRLLLPFPVLSDTMFRFGQLMIDKGKEADGKKAGKKKMINVSFLLDMSRLGPLRADFSILDRAITGRFLLSDKKTAGYVKSCIPQLKERLEKTDYHVHAIECDVAQKDDICQNCLAKSAADQLKSNVLNIVI